MYLKMVCMVHLCLLKKGLEVMLMIPGKLFYHFSIKLKNNTSRLNNNLCTHNPKIVGVVSDFEIKNLVELTVSQNTKKSQATNLGFFILIISVLYLLRSLQKILLCAIPYCLLLLLGSLILITFLLPS